MTKIIVTISQMSEGKINPKTELMEKPAWQLGFEDHTADILFRSKMLELLSRGYHKTVENFRRGDVTTRNIERESTDENDTKEASEKTYL